jgi:hypothetical protein
MAESSEQLIVGAGPASTDGAPAEAPASAQDEAEALAVAAKRKKQQLAIVGLLVLAIVLVIADQISKSCSYQPDAVEGEPPPPAEPTPCYQAALRGLVAWVRDNPGLGVLAVIVVYAVATVMFIPGSIITLSVGAAFASALGLPVRAPSCEASH